MPTPPRIRPFNQRPYDDNLSEGTNTFLDWVQTTLSALTGPNIVSGSGINALATKQISPADTTIISAGSRPQSIATPITFAIDNTGTSITFYWDGTHSSVPLTIHRDDGTTTGPIKGSHTVTGLTSGNVYFFYPFYQEVPANGNFGAEIPGVNFASIAKVALGTPAHAFSAKNASALQTQLARDHVPLAALLATSGVTMTPNATGTGGAGGGGSFGGGGNLL